MIPEGCKCEKYSCQFVVSPPAGVTTFRSSSELLRAFMTIAAQYTSGAGAPFYCGQNVTTDGRAPDFKARGPRERPFHVSSS